MHANSALCLDKDQLAEYREKGYLIYADSVFPLKKFQDLKDHFEESLAAWPPDLRPESMDTPHFTDLKLFDWLFSDEVLDLVEPIIGPDIALFSSHFICKPKGDGRRVPWHEDSFYWRDMMTPMEVVTVWLAIDASTRQNGAMQVIPRALEGNHEHEPVESSQNALRWELKKKFIDENAAVTIELHPNHASLHDAKLIHGSPANHSNMRRCGYTMRYMPTTVRFNPAALEQHNIYLARGRDHAGNRYSDPTKRYEELMNLRLSARRRASGH